jgi:hypothetical protein
MKALVYHGLGQKAWEEKPNPTILHPTDAVVRILKTAIGINDLHIIDSSIPIVSEGRIIGHEGVAPCDVSLPEDVQDDLDATSLYNLLENEILPMYYVYPSRLLEIVKNSMNEIVPQFGSNRMAKVNLLGVILENL